MYFMVKHATMLRYKCMIPMTWIILFNVQYFVSPQQYSLDSSLAIASWLHPTFVGTCMSPGTHFPRNNSALLLSNQTDFHISAPMCSVDGYWCLVGNPFISRRELAYRLASGCALDHLTWYTWSDTEDPSLECHLCVWEKQIDLPLMLHHLKEREYRSVIFLELEHLRI